MTENFDCKAASKRFSRVGWGVFAFLAVTLVIQTAVVAVLNHLDSPLPGELWFLLVLNIFVMYGCGLPTAVAVMKSRSAPKLLQGRKMSPGEFATAFCMAIGITYAGNIIGNILMAFTQLILNKRIANPLEEILDGTAIWIQLFSVLIIAPLLEEFIFRKCVVTALAGYSHKGAILISGLAFGLCHGNFYQFFYAFALGMMFAYIYLRTGRLRYTVALHFLVNFLGGAVPLFLRNGLQAVEAIENLRNLEELGVFLQHNASTIGSLFIYVLLMWGIAIAGIVLLIVKRKSFRFSSDSPSIPAGVRFRTLFVNPGILLMMLAGLFLFAANLLG